MKILINGMHYNVEIEGEGEPLMFLHGFTGSAENWRPFFPSWSEKYKVIAVDVIGHGETDAPADEDRYDMEHAVEDLMRILDHLDVESTNLLGYSMGGRLALSVAARYPEKVRALMLESSSPGLAEAEDRRSRIKRDRALADDIEQNGIEAFVDKWERIPLFSTQRNLPEDVRLAVRNQRLKNRAIGLANSLRGMGTGKQPPVWDELRRLNMPVMLVTGELDHKFCTIAGQMSERLPNGQSIVVPKAGHAIHVEQPRIFDKIVKSEFYQMVKGMKNK